MEIFKITQSPKISKENLISYIWKNIYNLFENLSARSNVMLACFNI